MNQTKSRTIPKNRVNVRAARSSRNTFLKSASSPKVLVPVILTAVALITGYAYLIKRKQTAAENDPDESEWAFESIEEYEFDDTSDDTSDEAPDLDLGILATGEADSALHSREDAEAAFATLDREDHNDDHEDDHDENDDYEDSPLTRTNDLQ
jgi:hypothetical protein